MKTTLFATALLATALFANNSPVGGPSTESPVRHDDSTKAVVLPGPAHQLPTLPDSLKAKIEQQAKEFETQKGLIRRDSAKGPENRATLDSLRKRWEAKRDTQVANIKNDTVRAKVEARIQKVSEHKATVRAKVQAKKAKIETKKATRPVPPTPAK